MLGGGLSLIGEPLRTALAAALPQHLMEILRLKLVDAWGLDSTAFLVSVSPPAVIGSWHRWPVGEPSQFGRRQPQHFAIVAVVDIPAFENHSYGAVEVYTL